MVLASSGSLVIPVHNASTEVAVVVVPLRRELFNGALVELPIVRIDLALTLTRATAPASAASRCPSCCFGTWRSSRRESRRKCGGD